MRGPLTATLSALVLCLALATSTSAATIVVVANPSVDVDSVSRAELSKIFLKRLRTWRNGQHARPVDQPPGSLRESFSRTVHENSLINIEVYWKRMIFSGRAVPPPVAATDTEVLEFVRSTPGAVGYVSAAADTQGVVFLRLDE